MARVHQFVPDYRPALHSVQVEVFERALEYIGGCAYVDDMGRIHITMSLRTKALLKLPARQLFHSWADVPATLVESVIGCYEARLAEHEASLPRCKECVLREVPNPPPATEQLMGIVCLCTGCKAAWTLELPEPTPVIPTGRCCSYCFEPIPYDQNVRDQIALTGSFQNLCKHCWNKRSRRESRDNL